MGFDAAALDAAQDAYLENADYAETASVSKARAFATACRKLLLVPKSAKASFRHEITTDPDVMRQEMNAAQQFAASASAGSVKHVDLRGFRD